MNATLYTVYLVLIMNKRTECKKTFKKHKSI